MQTTTTTNKIVPDNLGLTIYNKIGTEPVLLKVKFQEEKGSFSLSKIDTIKAVRINHKILKSAVFVKNCSTYQHSAHCSIHQGKWEKMSDDSIITFFIFHGTEKLPDISSVTSRVIVNQLRKLGGGCVIEVLPQNLFRRQGKLIIPIKILD